MHKHSKEIRPRKKEISRHTLKKLRLDKELKIIFKKLNELQENTDKQSKSGKQCMNKMRISTNYIKKKENQILELNNTMN